MQSRVTDQHMGPQELNMSLHADQESSATGGFGPTGRFEVSRTSFVRPGSRGSITTGEINGSSRPNLPQSVAVCCVKLLVGNLIAGSIIGRNGNTISSIRAQSGCNVKISQAGATDRLLVFQGNRQQVDKAIGFTVSTMRDAQRTFPRVAEPTIDNPQQQIIELNFLVPNSAVSLIIGRGGGKISALRESTHARIQVFNNVRHNTETNERIVQVAGDIDGVQACSQVIIDSIFTDPHGKPLSPMVVNPHHQVKLDGRSGSQSVQIGSINPFISSNGRPRQQPFSSTDRCYPVYYSQYGSPVTEISMAILKKNCEIYLQVPDNSVGIIVGKYGQHLSEIRNISGAKVSISQKGELVPDTHDRLVTISGPVHSIHTAHLLILQRLHDVRNRAKRPQHSGGGSSSSSSGTIGGGNSLVNASSTVPVQPPTTSSIGTNGSFTHADVQTVSGSVVN